MEKSKKAVHRKKNAGVSKAKKSDADKKEGVEYIELSQKSDAASRDTVRKKSKKPLKHKVIIGVSVALGCIVILALALAGTAVGVFMHYYNKTDYVADDSITTIAPADLETMETDIDDLMQEQFYVRRDVTNEDGEVVGTTYDMVDLSSLTDEERASVEAEHADEMEQASSAQKEALDQLAAGQLQMPAASEQDDVLVVKQEHVENEYEVEKNAQGEITTVKKDGTSYEVVSNQNGNLVAVKNDGADYEVKKDDNGNVVSISKGDQKYEIETGSGSELVVKPPETDALETAAPTVPADQSDIYNLLLIGTDLRANMEGYGKSDTMILISINHTKKTINMISFMRDLYANIPGFGVDKMNRAYKYGGGPLLMQTIEANYGVHIDHYAAANFYSLIDIIDSIGGVSINISAEEAAVANQYINEMCSGIGANPQDYYIQGSGQLQLNGMQAVGYCRIRYVGRYDFERTERQRRVLLTIFSTLRTKSIPEIDAFLNTALPKVMHNIPSGTVAKLLVNAPSYMNYTVNTYRVPFDGAYHYSGEILVPDFSYTIGELYNIINN